MLYPPSYVQPPQERFGTAQDGFRLRNRWCARCARLRPVFSLRGPRRHARLGSRRNRPVQDAAGPRCFPVPGHSGGPQGSAYAPRPRRPLPVATPSRRCPGGDGGRRYGGVHAVSDHSLTVLAGPARDYAAEAAPKIVTYVNGVRTEIQQSRKERGASPERVRDVPPPARISEVEATLQPPSLRDLGRSMANFVLRAVLLGTVGGLVGALRGRPSLSDEKPRGAPRRE
jgi:hypothetical protein